jgi:hypothetical protein
MKSTLTIELDSQHEFTISIHYSNNVFVDNLKQVINDHENKIHELKIKTEPEPGLVFQPSTAGGTFTPAEPYIKTPKNTVVKAEHKNRFANLKPIHCQTCNKEFVPHHNKCKWCPDCKSAKDSASKKVKTSHMKSD